MVLSTNPSQTAAHARRLRISSAAPVAGHFQELPAHRLPDRSFCREPSPAAAPVVSYPGAATCGLRFAPSAPVRWRSRPRRSLRFALRPPPHQPAHDNQCPRLNCQHVRHHDKPGLPSLLATSSRRGNQARLRESTTSDLRCENFLYCYRVFLTSRQSFPPSCPPYRTRIRSTVSHSPWSGIQVRPLSSGHYRRQATEVQSFEFA